MLAHGINPNTGPPRELHACEQLRSLMSAWRIVTTVYVLLRVPIWRRA